MSIEEVEAKKLTEEQIKLANAFSKMNDSTKQLKNTLGPLLDVFKKKLPETMKVFTKLKPILKEGKSSKFGKAMKGLEGVFKSMIGASIQGFALQSLMTLLEPFLNLLSLFSPIVEVLAGIFAEALIPVMMEIIPVVRWLIGVLRENKGVIMTIIQTALIPLKLIFEALNFLISGKVGETMKRFIIHLQKMGVTIMVLWDGSLKLFFVGLELAMKGIAFIWNSVLKPVFDGLSAIWNGMAQLFRGNLKPAVDLLLKGLGLIGQGFKNLINGILSMVNIGIDGLNLIPFVNVPKLPLLADGGIALGPSIIGEDGPEAAIPLDKPNPMTDLLEDLVFEMRMNRLANEQALEIQQQDKNSIVKGRY